MIQKRRIRVTMQGHSRLHQNRPGGVTRRQFQRTGPHTLRGVFTDAALPGGESVLKVLGISADSQWVLLAQLPLTVQARADGAQRALTKPGAVVGLKTQAWERHSSTAQPPSRTSFVDGTLQGSLQTDHGNEAWAIKSNTQIAGSTYRPEALQYGTRGAQAAQVDLGSYLVEGNQGAHTPYATRLALGHVQAGEHPLLANSIANRGLVLRQRLGERVELMLSSGSTDGVRSQISTPRPSW